MKYFAVLGFALVMCIASTSSAVLVVEARGFTMCTAVSSGVCTAGTTYLRSNVLAYHDTNCDWSGGTCERWAPKDISSFEGAKGVLSSCCMSAVGGSSAGFQFYYHDGSSWGTVDPANQGYVFNDPVPGECSVATYVFAGGEVDSGYDWDYDSDAQAARCLGWATFPGSGEITKGIEYWFLD